MRRRRAGGARISPSAKRTKQWAQKTISPLDGWRRAAFFTDTFFKIGQDLFSSFPRIASHPNEFRDNEEKKKKKEREHPSSIPSNFHHHRVLVPGAWSSASPRWSSARSEGRFGCLRASREAEGAEQAAGKYKSCFCIQYFIT